MLYCICCGNEMQPVMPTFKGKHCYQPQSGLVCIAQGNYGSTLFDPMEPEERGYLLFFVCDQCMLEKRRSVYFVRKPPDEEPVPVSPHL